MTSGSTGLARTLALATMGFGTGLSCGQPMIADPRVALVTEAQDLAEAGEATRDYHRLLQAACLRAEAGDVVSIDTAHDARRILPEEEDDLSIPRLLARAARLAPAAERVAIDAARQDAKARLQLCGPRASGVRGAGYLVRLIGDVKGRNQAEFDLPPLKPDEAILVTARADSFGRIRIELAGPDGPKCSDKGPAARQVSCQAMPPGGARSAKGYHVRISNETTLVSRVSVYIS